VSPVATQKVNSHVPPFPGTWPSAISVAVVVYCNGLTNSSVTLSPFPAICSFFHPLFKDTRTYDLLGVNVHCKLANRSRNKPLTEGIILSSSNDLSSYHDAAEILLDTFNDVH
jgi:hypothetical protein